MSTSDLTVTLVGWVATEPKHYTGAAATPFTSFRMANTRRYFDRVQNAWADGRTEWFTVKVWRQAALNVATSLRKGDPVMVHGRLATEQWDSPEGPRTSLVLEALAIGPDLTYGHATFARTVHVGGPGGGGGGAADTGTGEHGGVGAPRDDGGPGTDGLDDPWAQDGALPDDPDGGGLRYSSEVVRDGGPGTGPASSDGLGGEAGDRTSGAAAPESGSEAAAGAGARRTRAARPADGAAVDVTVQGGVQLDPVG